MTPERWQKVEQLFQQALTLAPERRGAFLSEATGADEEIRHEVEMLLAQSSPRTSPSPYAQEAAPVTTLPDGFRLGPDEGTPHETQIYVRLQRVDAMFSGV
jgi:hypothetical protein